jgi:predicted enzyme related to lactoylglutathione lyase
MPEQNKPSAGSVTWFDLTIPNAKEIKEFYSKVVGWKADEFPMGDYSDYVMTKRESSEPIAGICHRLGGNQNIPAGWIAYIVVDDLDSSLENCKQLGGIQLTEIKDFGDAGKFAYFKDPSGAVTALFEYL